MTEIQLFDIGGTGIRFGLTDDGTAYAVASDFARALGYRDAEKATRLLDEAEKGTQIVGTSESSGRVANRPVSVIFEDGLWELIFRSTLPGAKAIKARVKAILKEIRQTGRYESAHQIPQSYAEALELAARQAREIEEKEAALAVAAPKVEAHDAFMSADGSLSFSEVAKTLGFPKVGRNNLIEILREEGVLMQNREPYQRYAHHFNVVSQSYPAGSGRRPTTTTYVKPSGVELCRRILTRRFGEPPLSLVPTG